MRKVKRAQILLAADKGARDEDIARAVQAGTSTVYRTKRRFVEHGLEQALAEDPRPGASRKLSPDEEAMLVALACASPPAGRAKWTLELLADEMVRLTPHEAISRDTIGRRLDNDLHAHFGSWHLALAVFNAGYGAMMRACAKYNTNDDWELVRHEDGLPWEESAPLGVAQDSRPFSHKTNVSASRYIA